MYSLCVLTGICLQDVAEPHAVWETAMWGEEQGVGEGTWSPRPFLSLSSWVTKLTGISYLGSFLCGAPIIHHFPKRGQVSRSIRIHSIPSFTPSFRACSREDAGLQQKTDLVLASEELFLLKPLIYQHTVIGKREIYSLIPRIRCNLSKFSLITMRKSRPKELGEVLRVSGWDS